MADKSIEEKVKDIIVEQLGVNPEQVTPQASFIEDLGADSLDIVELVMAFEEEFSVEVPDEDAEKLQTVGDVTEVHRRARQAAIVGGRCQYCRSFAAPGTYPPPQFRRSPRRTPLSQERVERMSSSRRRFLVAKPRITRSH